ncbi:MAG: SURF1 family protein, partial [Candidatus Nanopelagicales bacterium]
GLAIIGFGLLSRWQWQRAEDRRTERLALDAVATAEPTTLMAALADPIEWEPVTVAGIYASSDTWLIRQRPLDGANGFWVVSLLSTDAGDVWVNRGWIPSGSSATAVVPAPHPPEGTVTVTGRLRWAEVAPNPLPTDLPDGQAPALDPAAWEVGEPDIYLQMMSSRPADPAVTPLPVPVIDEGRNISYAVQWVIFAFVALVGWFFFLRREAREDATAEAEKP